AFQSTHKIMTKNPALNNISSHRDLAFSNRLACSKFQMKKRPSTKHNQPNSFLFVVTPTLMGRPASSNPRPHSGKYLMNRIEKGTNKKAHLLITRRIAASGSDSVIMISTMTGWPTILIHRFRATNGKSDHRIETKQ